MMIIGSNKKLEPGFHTAPYVTDINGNGYWNVRCCIIREATVAEYIAQAKEIEIEYKMYPERFKNAYFYEVSID